jgi:hypothetical protein
MTIEKVLENKLQSQFQIISDGTIQGPKVINSKTGKPVGLIQKVTWTLDINDGISRCNLEILGMPANVHASVFNLNYINETHPSIESVIAKTVKKLRDEEKKEERKRMLDDIKTDEQKQKEEEEFIKLALSVAKKEELSSQTQGE